MKILPLFVCCSLFALNLSAKSLVNVDSDKSSTTQSNRFIIEYKQPKQLTNSRMQVKSSGMALQLFNDGKLAVMESAFPMSVDQLKALDPNILNVEIDHEILLESTVNDTDFDSQWAHVNTGQDNGTVGADMDTPAAWAVHTGSRDVVIGVIDTGIDYNHKDLKNNMWTNNYEIPGDGIDNDGNGYVDDVHGINAIYDNGNPMDDHQHGTHVAGIIGAEGNNEEGVSGVNWKVSLAGCKFLNQNGRGYISNAIQCVNYFVNLKRYYGVNIVALNNSWGGGGYSRSLRNTIRYARDYDILFVAAAGNKYNDNDEKAHYPSNYNVDNVIAVASSDRNDLLSHFSSYGVNTVDIAAPGSGIYSTFPNDAYGWISGSSMSTAQVSGAIALAKAYNANLSGSELKEIILKSGDKLNAFEYFTSTSKRLNVARVLDYAHVNRLVHLTVDKEVKTVIAGETAVFEINIDRLRGWNAPLNIDVTSESLSAASSVQSVTNEDSVEVYVPTTGLTSAGTYQVTAKISNGLFEDEVDLNVRVLPQGMSTVSKSKQEDMQIPDNDSSGIRSTIEIDQEGFAMDASVSVDISHPFIKDLTVSLVSPEGERHVLHERQGGSSDDIVKTYELGHLNNIQVNGSWSLLVNDQGNGDEGQLNHWTLNLNTLPNLSPSESADINVLIPDNQDTGIVNVLLVNEHVDAGNLSLPLNIEHPFIGDLTVTLISPQGTEWNIHNRQGGGQDDIKGNFDTNVFTGEDAFGVWRLFVSDSGRADIGSIKNWSLLLGNSEKKVTVTNDVQLNIPDHNDQGTHSTILVDESGTIASATIELDVTHPYISDLTITLVAPSGRSYDLHNRTGGSSDDIQTTIDLSEFVNESINGPWILKAKDQGRGDVGHVNFWTLNIQKH